MLFSDFLNPGNCFKLALVPIPGMIYLPESAEFRRKATLLRRIAVFVFAAQKPPGKRIERNHRETFFLHQREKFSLKFHGTAGCNVVGPKRNASALACPAVQALLPDGRRESLIRRYNAPCPNARSYP